MVGPQLPMKHARGSLLQKGPQTEEKLRQFHLVGYPDRDANRNLKDQRDPMIVHVRILPMLLQKKNRRLILRWVIIPIERNGLVVPIKDTAGHCATPVLHRHGRPFHSELHERGLFVDRQGQLREDFVRIAGARRDPGLFG